MDANKVVQDYEELLERALDIARHAPFSMYVDDAEFAKLEVDGESAELSWEECESHYDECRAETRRVNFQTALLTMPDDELVAYQSEQQKLANENRQKIEAERKAKFEQEERAKLAALKAKYEH